MQKKIFPVVLCLLSASALSAEVIESVSFNPSRFGQYERLTVSEEADLKGGLSTTNLNVMSAGAVSMTVSKPLADKTAFYVPTVDAIEGNGVSLTNACFSGSGADCRNYDASSATLPNTTDQPLVISSQSGEGSFERDSFMNRVTTLTDMLQVKAQEIRLNQLTVYGKENQNPYTYSGSGLKGVKLGGNDIPAPVRGYTSEKDGVTSKTLSNCELAWEERNTVQKEGKYDTYKVLVLRNCDSQGGTNPATECSPGEVKSCGDDRAKCQGTKTCGTNGTWGGCKRPNNIITGSNFDTYCSADAKIYNCGAGCAWSDASYSCYKLYNMDCPDNVTAHNWACREIDCEL